MVKLAFAAILAGWLLTPAKAWADNQENGGKTRLRFGLTAVAVESDVATHKKLIHIIEKRLNIPVETIYRKSYQEMSSLLESGGVDVAFVCGLPYVLDHEKFGLELLAAPVFNGKPYYQSLLIVHKDSKAASLEDLRGKIFAFSDPMSNSGFLVPVYNLSRIKETPESFFKTRFFTYSHSSSIEAVASHLADAANVDSYVWEWVGKIHPELISQTKIIQKSDFMPFTPFVIRPGLDKRIKARIQDIFLTLHNDPEGRAALNSMALEKFERMKDSDYDSIRRMRRSVSFQKVASPK
ncbi:MAG: phosphate/phosphite/phosphonate ABC transporter substrate-binding protein [Nitrospinae bacterium]|nr:phosphate/phosphite/phosphonate ABC transporter substrate-binding protein [Nitrospinota bacterium]